MWVLESFAEDILKRWRRHLRELCNDRYEIRRILGPCCMHPDDDCYLDEDKVRKKLVAPIEEFLDEIKDDSYDNSYFYYLDLFSVVRYLDPDANSFHVGYVRKEYEWNGKKACFNEIEIPIPSDHEFDPDIREKLEKILLKKSKDKYRMRLIELLDFDKDQVASLLLEIPNLKVEVNLIDLLYLIDKDQLKTLLGQQLDRIIEVKYSDLLEVSKWHQTD